MIGTSHEVWIWNNNNRSQRLRWKQNGILIGLYYQVDHTYTPVISASNQPNKITHLSRLVEQNDLLQIANGMDWYRGTNLAPACFGAGGSLVYADWTSGGFPEERMCLHPSLVLKHLDQKYGLQ